MRELHRPTAPVARLLVVALGLLGVVTGTAGSATQGGTSSTGTISGVRTWVAQYTSPRSRASTKPRPSGNAKALATATARQVIAAEAPQAQPVPAAPPVPGIEVRPPSVRAARLPATSLTAPGAAPRGVPRGRAPPPPTRI